MNIAVIGTGYVGLVTGALFAKYGNKVTCVDNNAQKVSLLQAGRIPIYEEGLEQIVKDAASDGRLLFTQDLALAVRSSEVSFIAVGTPSTDEGTFDLRFVKKVAEEIGLALRLNGAYHVVAVKSTVPPMTHKVVEEIIKRKLEGSDGPAIFDVVSNPEFLKEGRAVRDFESPDRIIVGTNSERAAKVMEELYRPFARRRENKLLLMSPMEAELSKLAANGFLATKVSYMNELARICDLFHADVMQVRKGMTMDERIGSHFMLPGPGFGGSCFPKDTSGLIAATKDASDGTYTPAVLQATNEANRAQKEYIAKKIVAHYGDEGVRGKTLAMWGLAFKADTDDVRDSPAIFVLEYLLKRGALMRVHDPKAMDNTRRYLGESRATSLQFCDKKYAAVEGADGLILMTEWPQYRTVDFNELQTMRTKVIFDGRNLFDPSSVKAAGFKYMGIGRR